MLISTYYWSIDHDQGGNSGSILLHHHVRSHLCRWTCCQCCCPRGVCNEQGGEISSNQNLRVNKIWTSKRSVSGHVDSEKHLHRQSGSVRHPPLCVHNSSRALRHSHLQLRPQYGRHVWCNMVARIALFDTALFKKMNILFEWIFWILKKWIFWLNEYSGFL